MSIPRVKENESFLKLLLTTSRQQQRVLLDTATNSQVDALTEILHNLLHVVPISNAERNSIKRKKSLTELAKITRSYKYRLTHVKKNKRLLLSTLQRYATELLEVVSANE